MIDVEELRKKVDDNSLKLQANLNMIVGGLTLGELKDLLNETDALEKELLLDIVTLDDLTRE